MSTIAYGDITPVNSWERVFTCFVMVTGTSIYAYGITSVVSMATGANQAERQFTQKKDEVCALPSERVGCGGRVPTERERGSYERVPKL